MGGREGGGGTCILTCTTEKLQQWSNSEWNGMFGVLAWLFDGGEMCLATLRMGGWRWGGGWGVT